MQLTIFVHVLLETFGESTRPTLVAMGLVDRTLALEVALRLTAVGAVTVDAPLEEPGTTWHML
jgi:hypothetical protein